VSGNMESKKKKYAEFIERENVNRLKAYKTQEQ
jgi:hypothetical protein